MLVFRQLYIAFDQLFTTTNIYQVRIIYLSFRNYSHANLMISVCLGLVIIFDQVKMKLKALKQD